ncbi:MAG: twin-arginine translocase subunit TatC [Chloroflexi bacterium]|nr:twin-arginine translocase subunit TatC [Chloroflexota bacterium]
MTDEPVITSIWDHFSELRRRLLISLAALAVTSLASFSLAGRIVEALAMPIGGLDKLQAIEVTETIGVFMRVSLLSGIILAMPILLYEALAFILPGLTPGEKRWVLAAIPTASLLFVAGAAFSYFIMLPPSIDFLISFMDVATVPRLSDYMKFVTNLIFWIGISFQLPLIAFLLAKVKLINAGMLGRYWRIAVIIISILAAVISPTVDPINMALLMLPLFILYLLSVLLAAIANPKPREKNLKK